MGESDVLRFPERSVFHQAATTVANGAEPLNGFPDQIASLGMSSLAVGMWPGGVALAAGIGAALGVATLAHQNHSADVKNTVDALVQSGSKYHTTEADNSA